MLTIRKVIAIRTVDRTIVTDQVHCFSLSREREGLAVQSQSSTRQIARCRENVHAFSMANKRWTDPTPMLDMLDDDQYTPPLGLTRIIDN
jgi:hypothetical protein